MPCTIRPAIVTISSSLHRSLKLRSHNPFLICDYKRIASSDYQNHGFNTSSQLLTPRNHNLLYVTTTVNTRKIGSRSTTINASNSQACRSICHHDKDIDRNSFISILKDQDLLDSIPLCDVRNFCFIAHVDHGKSSLASRVLQFTGNLGQEAQLDAYKRAGLALGDFCGRAEDKGKKDVDEVAKIAHAGIDTKEGSTPVNRERIELLDTLGVERDRGITVKASAASMLYPHPSAKGKYGLILLNMVDTPGHADFGSEVSRTLSSVEGAILLVDAAQGLQAQSLSVLEKAKAMPTVKTILPILTKADLPTAKPLETALSVSDFCSFDDPDSILTTSARTGDGIPEVLDRICCDVPAPKSLPDDPIDDKLTDEEHFENMDIGASTTLRARVVDSWFENKRGVVCLVQILSGTFREGDRVSIVEPCAKESEGNLNEDDGSSNILNHVFNQREHYSAQEIGFLLPTRSRRGYLKRGQMGYVIMGLRDPRQARPGTLLVLHNYLNQFMNESIYLPRIHRATLSSGKSVLYASVHPIDGEGFDELASAVDKLALNDSGLEIRRTAGSGNSGECGGGPFLGPGLRVGFQGLLHVEVFQQRLLDEYKLKAIVTPPKVPYTVTYLQSKIYPKDVGRKEVVEDLSKWPSPNHRFTVEEPVVDVRIISPMEYAGNVMELIKRKRGFQMETQPMDEEVWLFTASVPWGELVTDFHDELKNCTAGYASFDFIESDPPLQQANLQKVDIVLNGDTVEPLAFVSHVDSVQREGRSVCKRLQEVLPRMNFVTVIQAKAGGKIVASERIRAYRKDVLTTGGSKAVGGGDVTRKKKLLEKQKKGKKRQQSQGKVSLSQAAFNSVISRNSS